MSKANGASATRGRPSAAKAAVAEDDNTPKSCDWQGIRFELPAKLSPVVLFDIVEWEASEDGLAMFRLLRGILGADQFLKARNALPADGQDDALGELFEAVMEPYGTTPGESSASSTSS